MQGYFFARPMPADELEGLLRARVAAAAPVLPEELLRRRAHG